MPTTQHRWTAADSPSMRDRVAVVTGATGGLGFETALGLARLGAQVVLAGRNPAKGAAALARIRMVVPRAEVGFAVLDLARLSSVAAFAEHVAAKEGRVDVLVNNAGAMAYPSRRTTADGFEAQFGTNFLGHFALTARLLPTLLRAGRETRVVNVSSLAHKEGRIDLADLNAEKDYEPWTAYRQSKLAMLLFARELHRRAGERGWPIRSLAAHPGWARTDIISNGPGEGRFHPRAFLMNLVFRMVAQTAEAGALPILFAATAAEAEPGGYYGPIGRREIRGPVGPATVMPQAADAETGRGLWEASERLTGVVFPPRDAAPP